MPLHVINEETTDPQVAIYKRKTIITDAQIKTLVTSYVELVPAPGAGKLLVFHAGYISNNCTQAYTNINNADFFWVVQGNWDVDCSSPVVAYQFLGTTSKTGAIYPVAYTDDPTYVKGPIFGVTSVVQNLPLKLAADNTLGDFTGGDPLNTLEVTVFYSIVDL